MFRLFRDAVKSKWLLILNDCYTHLLFTSSFFIELHVSVDMAIMRFVCELGHYAELNYFNM